MLRNRTSKLIFSKIREGQNVPAYKENPILSGIRSPMLIAEASMIRERESTLKAIIDLGPSLTINKELIRTKVFNCNSSTALDELQNDFKEFVADRNKLKNVSGEHSKTVAQFDVVLFKEGNYMPLRLSLSSARK